MGRYLDIANRFMRELEAKRAAASVPSAHAADRDPPTAYLVAPEMRDWPDERPELWAERTAILEVEAGLPREVAEQTARDLCDPTLARRPARRVRTSPWRWARCVSTAEKRESWRICMCGAKGACGVIGVSGGADD